MKKAFLSLLLTLLIFLVACGGSSSNSMLAGTALTLNTTKANALINQTVQFTSTVPADWSTDGGSITNNGLYTAPGNTGISHSCEEPGQFFPNATATVDVAAEFLSLQKFVGGTSQPFSVTPVLSKLYAHGTLASAVIKDSETGQQADTNAYDIFVWADGTKAVFTSFTNSTYGGEATLFFDIGLATANADIGTGSAQTKSRNSAITTRTRIPTSWICSRSYRRRESPSSTRMSHLILRRG